jgi:hypothetical protein
LETARIYGILAVSMLSTIILTSLVAVLGYLTLDYVFRRLPQDHLFTPVKERLERVRWEREHPLAEVGQFARISIPLVRRIYPQLIADRLINVQPLTAPTGLQYYLRWQHAQNSGGRRPTFVPEKVDWMKEGF